MRGDLKIGIIGGSGMEDPAFISNSNSKDVSTSYGDPSSQLILRMSIIGPTFQH